MEVYMCRRVSDELLIHICFFVCVCVRGKKNYADYKHVEVAIVMPCFIFLNGHLWRHKAGFTTSWSSVSWCLKSQTEKVWSRMVMTGLP